MNKTAKCFATAALAALMAVPALAGTWTFGRQANAYSGTQCWITDGNGWSVYLSDNAQTTIPQGKATLGVRGKGYSAIKAVGSGGVLDLRDITITMNGVDYAITNLALPQWSLYGTSAAVERILANNVSSLGELLLTYSTTDAKTCNVKDIRLNGTFTSVPANCFIRAASLTNALIESPMCTEIGSEAFKFCRGLVCNVSQLIPRTVRSFGSKAFAGNDSSSPGASKCTMSITGEVVVDKLDSLGASAFLYCHKITAFRAGGGKLTSIGLTETSQYLGVFNNASSLKEVVLDTPDLTEIGQRVFNGATAVTNLVIGARDFQTCSATLGSALKQVTFKGRAAQGAVDNILNKVATSNNGKNCTIYAHKGRALGWKDLASDLTAAELAVPPPDGCFGVYRAGSRKAWLVHRPSPYAPLGTHIMGY